MAKREIKKRWCCSSDCGLQQLKHMTTKGCGNGSIGENCCVLIMKETSFHA
jgi:hypothetical protein